MAHPVLVRTYRNSDNSSSSRRGFLSSGGGNETALPPISSYAFADLLRAADSPELQSALDGIAEICAKNHMSLADEYAAHLPPFGEITAVTASRPQCPGVQHHTLTSVPEASSSGSDLSGKSRRHSIQRLDEEALIISRPLQRLRIDGGRRSISFGFATTAVLAESAGRSAVFTVHADDKHSASSASARPPAHRAASAAAASLQGLVARYSTASAG